MFWHEGKEHEDNLFSYNKTDFLKMTNQKSKKNKEDDAEFEHGDKNILDLTDPFRVDMLVSSDWGPGKIISINRTNKTITLDIEGTEKEMGFLDIRPYFQIYLHVYYKDLNLIDKKVVICANIFMDDTVEKLKKKIAALFLTNYNKVLIIHNGRKLSNDSQKLSGCSIYAKEVILVVINGACNF